MGYRHSSLDDYKAFKAAHTLLMVAMMSETREGLEKGLFNLGDFLATERDAAAIRAAKTKAEADRQKRLNAEKAADE